jgi:hypothetical protein
MDSNGLQGKVTEGGKEKQRKQREKIKNIFNVRIMVMLVVKNTLLGRTNAMRT